MMPPMMPRMSLISPIFLPPCFQPLRRILSKKVRAETILKSVCS
jgi:hypothetical protein